MNSSESPVLDDQTSKYGEKLEYDPEFKGPVKHRSCTDILCLFLFISFLAGWLVVAFFAYREGDPRILLYPTDTEGNLCGVGNLKDKKFLFFFDLMQCNSPKVVISGCPTQQVCVSNCPNETYYASPDISKDKLICKYKTDRTKKDVNTLVTDGDCAKLYFKSVPLLNRCIPEIFYNRTGLSGNVKDKNNNDIEGITVEKLNQATGQLAEFLSLSEMGEKVFVDFKTSWQYILLGLLFAMILSLVWIVLMRWLAGLLVWLSIFLVLAFCVFGCYYSSNKYIELEGQPGSEDRFKLTFNFQSYLALRKTWLVFAIVSAAIFAILFLVLVFLRKRIFIAIALIKEASRAVGTMMSTLLFPVITYVLMLVFFVFWATVALYIASSGKASFVVMDAPKGSQVKDGTICNPNQYNSSATGSVKCAFRTYGLQGNLWTSHGYNLFGLFWGLFFVVGMGQVSLSGAFSTYYWTKNKAKDVPCCAVLTSFFTCIRYHLGSVAFASLLIATVRFIRVLIEYFDKKLNQYDNKVTKFILWCMRCCFWCLEKILQFISKNAYIMIAIYGKNFCISAKRAVMLLMRNIIRVVVLDKITDFLLFMGKLSVVGATAAVSFYMFSKGQRIYKGMPDVHYNLLPPSMITLGAYLIASGFFSVYGMAVDTLFLCFLEDCERNNGTAEKPYYMSKELMKLLHKKNKFRDLTPNSKG